MANGRRNAKYTGEIKRITSIQECIYVSYHEASHTILALLYGILVSSVFIQDIPLQGWEGWTEYHTADPAEVSEISARNDLINKEVSIRYAGLIGERLLFKKMSGSNKFPSFWKNDSSSDTRYAADMIKKYANVPAGKKRYLYKKKLIKEVSNILEQHWNEVEIIAHALYDKRRLSFEEMKKLLLKKSQNKVFWKQTLKILEMESQSSEIEAT